MADASFAGQASLRPVVPFPTRGSLAQLAPLPTPLTPLVGRERAVGQLRAILRRPTVRLVTVTGPGGVGKTRVAIQAAQDLAADFPDGVAFVALASVRDPDFVIPTVAQALGTPELGERPLSEALAASLQSLRVLLVLDNLEHVLTASSELAALLAVCPDLTILATSQSLLHLSGEHDYPLPPLSLGQESGVSSQESGVSTRNVRLTPDPRPLTPRSEAVRLFVERARAGWPDFVLDATNAAIVAEICRRLDGLPLAIELAAARVRHLPLGALLSRLDQRLPLLTSGAQDQPDRLRTMRDAIAWSYDLLAPGEQTLFRRLAVFTGGFTLEAAGAVSRGSRVDPRPSTLDLVASLIDKSLIRWDAANGAPPRYAMLETLREYGLERLEAAGEAEAVRDAHAAYVRSLAEQAERAFWGERHTGRLQEFGAERDNVRAALAHALERDPETALRLASALNPTWWLRGHEREGRRWLHRTLANAAEAPAAVRAKALVVAGRLAAEQGAYEESAALAEEALDLARRAGDATGIAAAVYILGLAALSQGQDADARVQYDEAAARFRALGNRTRMSWALCKLAALGDLGTIDAPGDPAERGRAAAWYEEALTVFREYEHTLGIATALDGLARLASIERDYPRAVSLAQEALVLRWEFDDRRMLAPCLEDLANIAGRTGRAEQAARLYGAADALRRALGTPVIPRYQAEHQRALTVVGEQLGAAFANAWAAGRALPLEQAVALALAVEPPPAAESISPHAHQDERASRQGRVTEREREVLQLLASGRTNAEIADALFITAGTARIHVSNILAKLGARTRTEAASIARDRGLLDSAVPQATTSAP